MEMIYLCHYFLKKRRLRLRERQRLVQVYSVSRWQIESQNLWTLCSHKVTCWQVGTYVWKITLIQYCYRGDYNISSLWVLPSWASVEATTHSISICIILDKPGFIASEQKIARKPQNIQVNLSKKNFKLFFFRNILNIPGGHRQRVLYFSFWTWHPERTLVGHYFRSFFFFSLRNEAPSPMLNQALS